MEIISTGKNQLDPRIVRRIITSKHGDLLGIIHICQRFKRKHTRSNDGRMAGILKEYVSMETPVIVCGDLNIARTEDDI